MTRQQYSYCLEHNTYPETREPCWACANTFIQQAYEAGVTDGKAWTPAYLRRLGPTEAGIQTTRRKLLQLSTRR